MLYRPYTPLNKHVAIAIRLGALVESASTKGIICSKKHSNRSIVVVNINLEHIKNKEKDKDLPTFYIVLYILAVSVLAHREVLYIGWKGEVLDWLFFCDVSYITRGGNIIKEKAFLYAKYRPITRFKEALELYQLRQALGKNINKERNQTIGYLSSTYKRYYIPTIYFGKEYKNLIYSKGLYPVTKAKGTKLYYITGKGLTKFKLLERATITRMLFIPFKNEKA
ncbi:hypothetical protein V2W45_1486644 [Cenococcum geophilum]